MNKQNIRKDLSKLGITVESFEFNENGHRLELKINQQKGIGWEELDSILLDGFSIVSPRYIDGLRLRVTLVPCNEREFTYYIQKYVKCYGLSRSTALIELERIVSDLGDFDALSKLSLYKNKFKGE